MMDTGIYIRALIEGEWQSVDIVDPRLPVARVIEWCNTLSVREKRALMLNLIDAMDIESQAVVVRHTVDLLIFYLRVQSRHT